MTEHDRPSEQDPATSDGADMDRTVDLASGSAVSPWAAPPSASAPTEPHNPAPADVAPASPPDSALAGSGRTGAGAVPVDAWAPPAHAQPAPWSTPPGFQQPGFQQPGFAPPGFPQGLPPQGWAAPVEQRPDPGSWTFLDVLAGLGVVLLLSSLLTWPFLVWTGAPPALVLVVAGLLPIWIGMLGTSWWAVRRRGTGSWRDDLGLHFTPVDFAIGLGVGLGFRLAAGLIVAILSVLQGGMGEGNLQVVTGNGLSDAALWFVMIGAVTFIAPVIEEIFFRGLLLRSIGSTMVRTRPAWTAARRRQVASLVSAGLFTAVHLTELTDPLSVLPLVLTWFGLGYFTAQLTLKTGRLGPAIISHIVFNGVAAVALLSMT